MQTAPPNTHTHTHVTIAVAAVFVLSLCLFALFSPLTKHPLFIHSHSRNPYDTDLLTAPFEKRLDLSASSLNKMSVAQLEVCCCFSLKKWVFGCHNWPVERLFFINTHWFLDSDHRRNPSFCQLCMACQLVPEAEVSLCQRPKHWDKNLTAHCSPRLQSRRKFLWRRFFRYEDFHQGELTRNSRGHLKKGGRPMWTLTQNTISYTWTN